jgi:hypothetical protein
VAARNPGPPILRTAGGLLVVGQLGQRAVRRVAARPRNGPPRPHDPASAPGHCPPLPADNAAPPANYPEPRNQSRNLAPKP